MARYSVSVDTSSAKKELKKILEDEEIRKRISLHMLSYSQASFARQGLHSSNSWKPRGIPNNAGIIRDINEGRTPSQKRFTARPALVDTNRLRTSLYSYYTKKEIGVGTDAPYAQKVFDGGVSVIKKSGKDFNKKLWAWMKRVKEDAVYREHIKRLGFLFAVNQINIRSPGREFIGFDPDEVEKIIAEVLEEKYGR